MAQPPCRLLPGTSTQQGCACPTTHTPPCSTPLASPSPTVRDTSGYTTPRPPPLAARPCITPRSARGPSLTQQGASQPVPRCTIPLQLRAAVWAMRGRTTRRARCPAAKDMLCFSQGRCPRTARPMELGCDWGCPRPRLLVQGRTMPFPLLHTQQFTACTMQACPHFTVPCMLPVVLQLHPTATDITPWQG